MGEKRGHVLGWVLLILVAIVAVGCGDDESTGAGPEETTGQERPFPNVKGPTREFLVPGGDNIVQLFGEEASAAEREKASRVIHAWMKVRVAEDWAGMCRYLAQEYIEGVVEDGRGVSKGKADNCPEVIAFFGHEASGTSGNTLTGPIDSLRVKKRILGDLEMDAYAQWHGPEHDWVVPLKREGGVWKVAAAGPIDRNK